MIDVGIGRYSVESNLATRKCIADALLTSMLYMLLIIYVQLTLLIVLFVGIMKNLDMCIVITHLFTICRESFGTM